MVHILNDLGFTVSQTLKAGKCGWIIWGGGGAKGMLAPTPKLLPPPPRRLPTPMKPRMTPVSSVKTTAETYEVCH